MADNSLHNAMVGSFQGQPEEIVDKPKSIADVMNNLGIRLKDETLKQIDTIKDTSGNLKHSVKFNTKIFGESFATELYLADYYDYVNKGVRGSAQAEQKNIYEVVTSRTGKKYQKPLKNASGKNIKIAWQKHNIESPYSFKSKRPPLLREWLNNKGLKYNPFAVQESMFARGIKGNGFWDKVVEDVKNGEIHSLLIQDLKSAGKLGILNEIKKIIK